MRLAQALSGNSKTDKLGKKAYFQTKSSNYRLKLNPSAQIYTFSTGPDSMSVYKL